MTRKIFRSLDEACEAVGVDPHSCRATSRRWAIADVLGDPHGKGDARIRLFDDDKGGVVWNWKLSDGDQCAVFFTGQGSRREIEHYIETKFAQSQMMDSAEHKAMRKFAQRIYDSSDQIEDRSDHGYLLRKNVDPARYVRKISARRLNSLLPQLGGQFNEDGTLLVLPAVSSDVPDKPLKLWSLQFIAEDGAKRFLRHGRMRGCFCPINGLPRITDRFSPDIHLVIGEGFATVQSVVQRSIERACGVVAFSCHGLIHVAQSLRARYPNALITVLGDKGNGSEQAKKAAILSNGAVFFPEFSQETIDKFRDIHGKVPTDWNDFYEVAQYV